MGYAENTSVSSERSRMEIERTLARYGAKEFFYGWKEHAEVVGFKMSDRNVRFEVKPPSEKDPTICRTPAGRDRAPGQIEEAMAQEVRRRWRALLLVVKAKLEAVHSGISTLEQEFLAHIVLPNGRLVGEYVAPVIDRAYKSGRMLPAWEGEEKS